MLITSVATAQTTTSTPTWIVIKPTDHGLPADILHSIYFDADDSTFILGAN